MCMQRVISPKTFIFSSVLAAALMLAWALPASAQVTFLFDKDQYIANHPDQLVQNFDAGKVSPGNFEFCDQPVNVFSDDDCFDPRDIFPGLAFAANPNIFLAGPFFLGGANPNNALARGGGTGTFDVFFESGVTSAGMDIGCFAEGVSCNALQTVRLIDASDNLIDAVQVNATDEFDTFLGFDSTIPVARVNISGPEEFSQGVDEVRFGQLSSNIPTLSEWGMIAAFVGLGLVGVYFAVRKRRQQAV